MAFWKGLGKGLLKVGKIAAPIALGATGVGLPAAMAVSAGLNALDKKVSGGTWKGALGAGAMGAATGAMGGMAGQAMRGIGPTGGFMGKMPGVMKGAGGLMKRFAQRQGGMNQPRQPYPYTPGFNPNLPHPMMSRRPNIGPVMQSPGMMAPRASQFQNLGY